MSILNKFKGRAAETGDAADDASRGPQTAAFDAPNTQQDADSSLMSEAPASTFDADRAGVRHPMSTAVIIRSERVILSSRHSPMPLAIHVRDGVIREITQWDLVPVGAALHDCGDSVVMPGIVDTHAHINEPGRTEWEGFATATRAGLFALLVSTMELI